MDAALPVEAGKSHLCVVTGNLPARSQRRRTDPGPAAERLARARARSVSGAPAPETWRAHRQRRELPSDPGSFPALARLRRAAHRPAGQQVAVPKLDAAAPGCSVRCNRGASRLVGGAGSAAPRRSRAQRLSHQFPQLQPALPPGLAAARCVALPALVSQSHARHAGSRAATCATGCRSWASEMSAFLGMASTLNCSTTASQCRPAPQMERGAGRPRGAVCRAGGARKER